MGLCFFSREKAGASILTKLNIRRNMVGGEETPTRFPTKVGDVWEEGLANLQTERVGRLVIRAGKAVGTGSG